MPSWPRGGGAHRRAWEFGTTAIRLQPSNPTLAWRTPINSRVLGEMEFFHLRTRMNDAQHGTTTRTSVGAAQNAPMGQWLLNALRQVEGPLGRSPSSITRPTRRARIAPAVTRRWAWDWPGLGVGARAAEAMIHVCRAHPEGWRHLLHRRLWVESGCSRPSERLFAESKFRSTTNGYLKLYDTRSDLVVEYYDTAQKPPRPGEEDFTQLTMPLTLIKEDGSGRSDANSYADAARRRRLPRGASLRHRTGLGRAPRRRRRRWCWPTRLIDAYYQFRGFKVRDAQALQWPALIWRATMTPPCAAWVCLARAGRQLLRQQQACRFRLRQRDDRDGARVHEGQPRGRSGWRGAWLCWR